jgi:molecular chaperone GrpE (heat shock protein)
VNWKFWQKKSKQGEVELTVRELADKIEVVGEEVIERTAGLAGQVAELGMQLPGMEQVLAKLEQGVAENSLQTNKLSRLQYKIGQEMLAKLDQFAGKMAEGDRWQEAYQSVAKRLAVSEQQHRQVIQRLVTWLDDLDSVIHERQKAEPDSWYQLFQQWNSQILQLLDNLGVSQLEVMGQAFDPRLAEALGTVKASEVNRVGTEVAEADGVGGELAPCQIVQVVKRGYWEPGSGKLLRKAQVITVEEKGGDEVKDEGDGERESDGGGDGEQRKRKRKRWRRRK